MLVAKQSERLGELGWRKSTKIVGKKIGFVLKFKMRTKQSRPHTYTLRRNYLLFDILVSFQRTGAVKIPPFEVDCRWLVAQRVGGRRSFFSYGEKSCSIVRR